MKYEDCLKKIFDAYLQDRSEQSSTPQHLLLALQNTPKQWRKPLTKEFKQIFTLLRQDILKCPHPEDKVLSQTPGHEECPLCGASRFWTKDDDKVGMFGSPTGTWSDWDII